MPAWQCLLLSVGMLFSLGPAPAAAPPLKLRWFGHACFLLTSPSGTTVLMDPFGESVGYAVPRLKVDAVTISHDHFDHNNTAAAQPGAKIIRGLTETGWATLHETVAEVKLFTVPTYHDAEQGAKRGRNAIFVFQVGGLTVAHLGDLGHVLSAEQQRAVGPVDVLLLPVGGFYTIDAAQATQVMNQLKPKIVIPMHFKTDRTANLPIAGVEEFLQGKPKVQRVQGNELSISSLPAETTILVLDYHP